MLINLNYKSKAKNNFINITKYIKFIKKYNVLNIILKYF